MYIDFKRMSDHDKMILKKTVEDCGFLEKAVVIDFDAGIPLDNPYVMTEKVINEGTCFYPKGNRTLGGCCYLRLVGDDSVSPNFWGMARDTSGGDYQVGSGVVNHVHIWFDGSQVMYRIFQTANSATPKATFGQAQVDFNDGTKIGLYYDQRLSRLPLPELSCFTLIFQDKPVNVVSVEVSDDDQSVMTITIDVEIPNGQLGYLTYIPSNTSPLTDGEGYIVDGFTSVNAYRSN